MKDNITGSEYYGMEISLGAMIMVNKTLKISEIEKEFREASDLEIGIFNLFKGKSFKLYNL